MASSAVNSDDGIGRKQLQLIRRRSQELAEQRVSRIRDTLTREQQDFFELLPLLFHLNHPTLPGFISTETPAGIPDYQPGRTELLLARRYARSLKSNTPARRRYPIRGLYLMGSMGSLGQDANSDMDFWLCYDDSIGLDGLNQLKQKIELLEQHAGQLGLHAHFFLMQTDKFRAGEHQLISNESSGDTQHHLLLDEFYRSSVPLAGLPLLWWLIPPEHEKKPHEFSEKLIAQGFIQPELWLDFGGLAGLPAAEFFSAAHWLLVKGIDSPYKALLKLILFEAYATDYPNVRWLCHETKHALWSKQDIDLDDLDPYRLLLDSISRYLLARGEAERLHLVHRAFYFKTGIKLSNQGGTMHWKHQQLKTLTKQWGWDEGHLLLMDSRASWKLERVLSERDLLVAELSRSYRLLTDFARKNGAVSNDQIGDLALLGRKLYAALERRPGKIDKANPSISTDLSEAEIWLQQDSEAKWQLFLEEPGPKSRAAKSTRSLLEMLAWAHFNGIIHSNTLLHHESPKDHFHTPEHERILEQLRRLFPYQTESHTELDNFRRQAYGEISLAFINVGSQSTGDNKEPGYQVISGDADPLSHSDQADYRIERIDHLFSNSWGEIQVENHHQGTDSIVECLCRHLDLFWPLRSHDSRPKLQSWCFTSTRGGIMAERLQSLSEQIWQHFKQHGADARYMLAAGEHYYLIQQQKDHFHWTMLNDEREVVDFLTEPLSRFQATHIDERAMPGSMLPLLYSMNQADQIQLFYRVRRNGIAMYVLDQQGALFEQWLPDAREKHFLIQQQRFFDTLQRWQLLAVEDSPFLQPDSVALYRLLQDKKASTGWKAKPIVIAHPSDTDYVELTLNYGPGGPWEGGFSLICGSREFSSVTLGKQLYTEVTQYLRGQRLQKASYPVYLTGVVSVDQQSGHNLPLVDLLRFKRALENRLAEAMQNQ